MNFYQEIAQSHVDALIHKISVLALKDIPSFLKEICEEISNRIRTGISEISDDKDLKTHRFQVSYVNELIDIFSKTNPDISSSWSLPLINEFYDAANIDREERKVLIIHSDDSSTYSVYADILSSFRGEFDFEFLVDVFLIPSEARFDIASISLVAHETAHVYLNSHKAQLFNFIEREINAYIIKREGPDLFAGVDINRHKKSLSSHIEEYICDSFGHLLLGPAFDFALLKLFCNSEFESADVTDTHPPVANRIKYSLENFKNFKTDISELDDCLRYMSTNFTESPRNDHDYIKLAESISSKFVSEYVRIEPQFNKENLILAWGLVVPELNFFRPPFETVSVNEPRVIRPSQALVIGTLYFYGQYYKKKNEFYLQSTLPDEEKYSILRKRTIEHIRYAISNYDFVKKARARLNFDGCKSDLDSTLWTLREKKVGGRSIPHVVIVPTIDPKVQYSSNSIDLRLGSNFLVNRLSKYTHISPDLSVQDVPIESHYDEYFINVGDEFTLHPHQFILAQTLEYVCVPPDFYALVLGRSTWGRLGLNIATATAVGSGFRGCITLELRNLGETPLKLKVGIRICQICLIPIPISNSPAGYFANASKYIGPVSPEVPKIRKDHDWDLLK